MTDETTDREAAREWWGRNFDFAEHAMTDEDAWLDMLAELVALGRSGPAWTGASPVTPGWYFWRASDLSPAQVRRLVHTDHANDVIALYPQCQWSDRPLCPPGDASE